VKEIMAPGFINVYVLIVYAYYIFTNYTYLFGIEALIVFLIFFFLSLILGRQHEKALDAFFSGFLIPYLAALIVFICFSFDLKLVFFTLNYAHLEIIGLLNGVFMSIGYVSARE